MKNKNVLVVAAHPDDEVLGCAATIMKHTNLGHNVYLLVMTNGVSARAGSSSDESIKRKESLIKSSEILGIKKYLILDFPDNQMDSVPLLSIIQDIESFASEIGPEIVYTHSLNDLNIDHKVTAQAVVTAFRPTPASDTKEIYFFEVPSSTEWGHSEFLPSFFVDVDEVCWAKKLEALECYAQEMRESPHPRSLRSIESLAIWRGSSAGLERAEAFEIHRIIH